MIETITIDTDTHVVVPVELLKKARLCIEDYIEGAPSDGTDEKCMDDISSILAIKQPEQAQQSDGTVINYGTMVSAEFLECFNHAFSFLANGHSIGQCFDMMKFARAELIKSMKNKPAPRQIPPINQELDEFISGLVAKELAKRGSRKIETAPRPVPTCDWQEDSDGIWETSCGEAWVCTEGTPAENNMKYCHSCGKHLKEHRYAEPDGGAV